MDRDELRRIATLGKGYGSAFAEDLRDLLDALDRAERERDEARADFRAVAEALGAMHEPCTGPSWPGTRDEVVDVARTLREQVDVLRDERDEARANYAFMVERAADQKLDGYRELGARAAAAEERAEKAERELQASESCVAFERVTIAELRLEAHQLRTNLHLARLERDEARAERDALHVALELAEVEVALDRSWCRICRTECRGAHRGRREHMHATGCVLNIRAQTQKAVKP